MERLPNELLLLVFRYLHKFDLLYSFHNLNKRFQQIIEPYSYNINLSEETDVSYKHFLLFINDILPIHGTKIRSLTLNGYHQTKLLYSYLHFLTNLESFTLQSENKIEQKKFGAQPSIVRIKKILNGFKNQLHSLTIIIFDALKEFSNFDEFQSLTDNFSHLQIFEYYIRTNYQPNLSFFPNVQQLFGSSHCFYTLPQPQFFDTILSRTTCKYIRNSNQLLQELFDCKTIEFSDEKRFQAIPTCLFQLKDNIKFVNLKELQIHTWTDDITPDVLQLFSKVISLSPNLNTLDISARDPMKIIEQLTEIFSISSQSKTIIHLTYRKYGEMNSYSTFCNNLSKIFPNLKTLTFSYDIHSLDKDHITIITNYIPKLIKSFPQLIHFKTEIQHRNILETCKQVFKEIQQQTENNFLCFSYEIAYSFNIWF